MKNNIFIFSLSALLALSSLVVYAQQAPRLQFYDVSSGLPSNHLYKIVQDKKGFLWIATENGISRFDGHSFKNYSVKEGLIDNDIINIFLDAVGNIWCIPFAGSPFYYDINKEILVSKQTVPALGKIVSTKFISAHPNADSSVSFHDDRKIYRFKNDKLLIEQDIAVPNTSTISYYAVIFGKSFLLFSNGKLFQLDGTVLQLVDSLPFTAILRSGNTEKGNEVVMNNVDNVVIKFSINKNSKIEGVYHYNLARNQASTSFLAASLGVAATNQSIYLLNRKTLELENIIPTYSDNLHIFEDREGILWVGTADKGLIKVTTPIIKDYDIPFANNKQIQTVYETAQGLVLGNSKGEIFVKKGKNWNIIPETSFGSENQYLKKIVTSSNNTFIGGAFSFSYYNNKDYLITRKYLNKALTRGIKDLYVQNDSILYVASVGGLKRINTNTWVETFLDSLRSSCITIDNKGRIYRGSKSGISVFENGKMLPTTTYDPSFSVNFIRFATSPDGIVWGGTSNDTLYAFKDLKVIKKITFSDRNYGSLCKGLQSVRPGELWYATDNGLIKINYKIYDNDIGYSSILFGSSEGLDNCTINDIFIFNDTITIATNRGLKRLCINTIPKINTIPAYLSEIFVNSTLQKYSSNIELSNSSEYLQLIYSTVSFNGAKPRIQYKIDETQWQNLNGNALTLTNMKPGKYIISARAINKDGQPSSFINKFQLTVQAPFWKKPWFILTSFLAAILATIFFLQYRNKQKIVIQHAQAKAIALQREKITADLHDDIGASLSSVQINSAVAAKLFDTNPKESKMLLSKLEKQAQYLSERIGDFIWSMKPGKDEFLNIRERIKNYAAEILNAKNIQFKISVTKKADELLVDFDIRKNVLLIAKEAINNAAKYSEGTNVWISINDEQKDIILSVKDDGKGIDLQNKIGNGLANMQKRAQELGGSFEIKHRNPSGTVVVARIPIPSFS